MEGDQPLEAKDSDPSILLNSRRIAGLEWLHTVEERHNSRWPVACRVDPSSAGIKKED